MSESAMRDLETKTQLDAQLLYPGFWKHTVGHRSILSNFASKLNPAEP